MKLEENIESLKKQLKDVEVMYYKVLGAIEAMEALETKDEDKGKKREK